MAARIELSEGRWVRLRPMLQDDENLIGRMASLEGDDGVVQDVTAYYKIKLDMTEALDEATLEASWEGGFGKLPKDEILVTLMRWDRSTEEEALPPENGTSSETPSEDGS